MTFLWIPSLVVLAVLVVAFGVAVNACRIPGLRVLVGAEPVRPEPPGVAHQRRKAGS